MAHVVHLEIISVCERRGIGIAVALFDKDRRVDVAIAALRFRDGCDDFVKSRFECGILLNG